MRRRGAPVRTIIALAVIAIACTSTRAGAALRGDGGQYHNWVILGLLAAGTTLAYLILRRR